MSHFDTVRDATGRIVGFASPGEASQFSQLLAETMTAVGATPAVPPAAEASPPPRSWRLGRFEQATLAIGLLAVLAAVVVLHGGQEAAPPVATRPAATTDDRRPTTDHRSGAIVPAVSPSPTPESPTATTELPTPTTAIVYVEVAPACDAEVNPAFVVQLPVYDGSTPIGQVTGASCDSQQDAQAKAEEAAVALLAAQPTVTPTPTMIVPRPPTNRPKPQQPPTGHDSGQSPIEIRLAAAGWRIAQVRQAIQP